MVTAVTVQAPDTVTEGLRQFLAGFEGVEPALGPATDLAGEKPGSLALSPAGEEKVATDIIGNRRISQRFWLYRSCLALDEADRRQNQSFWEQLRQWLENQEIAGKLPRLPEGCQSEELLWEGAAILEASGGKSRFYRGALTLKYTRKAPR